MIIFLLIVTHILVFCLSWYLCSKATQAYIRSEIMENKAPFDGKELEALKKFVNYKEKQP